MSGHAGSSSHPQSASALFTQGVAHERAQAFADARDAYAAAAQRFLDAARAPAASVAAREEAKRGAKRALERALECKKRSGERGALEEGECERCVPELQRCRRGRAERCRGPTEWRSDGAEMHEVNWHRESLSSAEDLRISWGCANVSMEHKQSV
jgi:hypothetical protein